MKRPNYWMTAVFGLVCLVVGVLGLSDHHTLGIVAIVVGVLVMIVGIVMALRTGGGAKKA